MAKRKAGKLTPKQAQFVTHYLSNGLNATKAASAAGYSVNTAAEIGAENLRKPLIAEEIAKRTEKTLAKLDISPERTLDMIGRLAFFDPKRLFEDDGSLKLMRDIDEETRSVIAGLEVSEIFEGHEEQKTAIGLMKKVKLADRLSALDKLMRYHALYRDKVEHSGSDGGPLQFVLTRVGAKEK